MKYVSTRATDGAGAVALSEAIRRGLAPDGGLFVPEALPRIDGPHDPAASFGQVALRFLRPFFAGDRLEGELEAICKEAFTFDVPLRSLPKDAHLLELFHGPTAAFKDVGARFLARVLQRLAAERDERYTILVATSGDTGSAVAAAVHRVPRLSCVVLYPKGKVSQRQAHQLSCWGDNVRTLAVEGTFDDCQGLVKRAFSTPELRERYRLTSANSINLGRMLPQSAYHAWASARLAGPEGREVNVIVPTGNLGNAVACLWAREVGFPIGRIVMSGNANRAVVDYLATGEYAPRPSIETLANAMDVGAPSNMERLRWLYPTVESEQRLSACSYRDVDIQGAIERAWRKHRLVLCPHTATAWLAFEGLDPAEREAAPWLLVATAHPAKFEQVVEPIVGHAVPLPAGLAEVLERPPHAFDLAPTLEALEGQLADFC